ncbi:unnamed protein product [Symbiodinium sp. CCMP2456]|nr:unnamed protein product [Symbiodinium sp. CCMP2456]
MRRSRAQGRTVILLLVFQLVPDPQYLRWPCEFIDLQHDHFGFRRHPRPRVVNNIGLGVAFHEDFLGRTREKNQLKKDISDTQVSGVCILGKRGIGKTRLAVEAVQEATADVKWLITADSRMAVKQGLINFAAEMELSDPLIHDGDKLALEWLANAKVWILVLDNVQSFADFTDLLPSSHRGTIVATAVQRCGAPAVKSMSLGPLEKRDASELLQKLAHREDDSGARQLASALAGLPVALVQAASIVSASNVGFESFAQQFPRLQISTVARAPFMMELRYRIIGKVLWQTQREFLENEGHAASISLVQFMSTLSPNGVSKRLLADLTGFENGKYQEAVTPLNSLSIVRMDSRGSSCRLHWLSQHGIRAELVKSGNASMLQTVLEGLMQPVGKEWWYPASFYRVSKVVFEHAKFLLNSWHLERLTAKAGHSDKLANLTCQARVAVGGYAYYNLADARLGRRWMQNEIERWPRDSLQYGVCSALLALVTSDSDRKASRRFDELAVGTITRIRDDSVHDDTLAVYVYVLANSLRLAAGDHVDESRQQRLVDELEDHIGQLEPEPRAHVHCSLGRWYQYREELDLARDHTRACRRILRAHHLAKVVDSSMELSIAYTSERLAALFLALGQFHEAKRSAHEASLLFEHVFGPNHRRRARSLVSLGLAAAEVHGPDKGLPHCQRALKILRDVADDTTATAKALLCTGKFSRHPDALAADPCGDLGIAQKLFEQINGAEHLDTVQCRIERARCMLDRIDQTKHKQVEQLLQKDFERLEHRNETLPKFLKRQLLDLHADIFVHRANQAMSRAKQYRQRADALRHSTKFRSILGIIN